MVEADSEAVKCLLVARKALGESDYAKAVKFAEKSIRIQDSPLARSFLARCREAAKPASTNTSASDCAGGGVGSAAGASETVANARRRQQEREREREKEKEVKKPFTAEQRRICIRVLGAKDLYGVLGVERAASDDAIKKAYRKLAMHLHPDKNGAPEAEEAFKRISKAFQILNDTSKRRDYDHTGQDPDERPANAMRRGHSHGGYDDGFMTPEDLFRAFFGGMTQDSSVYSRTYYRSRTRSNHAQSEAQSDSQASVRNFVQMVPLLLFLLISLLSSLFSSSMTKPQDFSLTKTKECWRPETTHPAAGLNGGTPFWASNNFPKTYPPKSLYRLNADAEVEFATHYLKCAQTHRKLREELNYYRNIGSRKARQALEKLRLSEAENPYCKAAQEIRVRHSSNKTQPHTHTSTLAITKEAQICEYRDR